MTAYTGASGAVRMRYGANDSTAFAYFIMAV